MPRIQELGAHLDAPVSRGNDRTTMEYRRLGRTGLRVSAVGLGTCQLRLVPEQQAVETLLRSFALGVNMVHTAADYGNAEELVARAVAHTSSRVIVASQGYDVPGNSHGPVAHFERLFETTCERLRSDRLDLYGIACIDDREYHQENVWGRHGMVEFLLDMKARGRLNGIFCTTHGSPEYLRRLVVGGVFDAVMIAYNILGYHLLSYPPPPDRPVESLPRNQQEIFSLCGQHNVGLMIMKPLGGGLLCTSKAFPPRHDWHSRLGGTTAGDILRSILVHPEVACVVPGTASVEEAEENARSGCAPIELKSATRARLAGVVADLRTTVCSRCGACDTLCSQRLPVSSIFWAGLLHLHPSAVLEQPDNIEYFRQHPSLESICATCPDVTCLCPAGIDIPRSLAAMHSWMVDLMRDGLIPAPDSHTGALRGDDAFGASIVSMDVPVPMERGRAHLCRLHVENAGARGWLPHHREHQARVALGIFVDGTRTQMLDVTQDVHRGGRWHFLFEVTPPASARRFQLRLQLLGEHQNFSERLGPTLLSKEIAVVGATGPRPALRSWLRRHLGLARGLPTASAVTHIDSGLNRPPDIPR
jgi:predicted aldo/keto reductase-like oxidoreductase